MAHYAHPKWSPQTTASESTRVVWSLGCSGNGLRCHSTLRPALPLVPSFVFNKAEPQPLSWNLCPLHAVASSPSLPPPEARSSVWTRVPQCSPRPCARAGLCPSRRSEPLPSLSLAVGDARLSAAPSVPSSSRCGCRSPRCRTPGRVTWSLHSRVEGGGSEVRGLLTTWALSAYLRISMPQGLLGLGAKRAGHCRGS